MRTSDGHRELLGGWGGAVTFYAFGFAVQGWWVGVVVGTAVLILAIGNWRLRWHVPVLDTLRDLDPPFLAGGQAAIGTSFLVTSMLDVPPPRSGWHTAILIAVGVCFVGGLLVWGYGEMNSVGPPEEGQL